MGVVWLKVGVFQGKLNEPSPELAVAIGLSLLTLTIKQTTFFYMGYAITISAPFIVSALFIFGASGFGDFTRIVDDLVPLPSIQQILGLESDFLDVVTGLIETLYELIQEGVESVVDLILQLPSGSQFNSSIISQFAGCCITLFFLVSVLCLNERAPRCPTRIRYLGGKLSPSPKHIL